MSVFTTFRLDIRPFSGYADPSLPIAAWVAQGDTVGDASGGTITLEFRIHIDTDPVTSEFYNLEQIQFDASSESIRDVMLQTRNMDSFTPERTLFDQRWQFETIGVGGVSFSALPLDRANMLPLWLGAPNKNEGDAGIRLVTTNGGVGVQYLATLQGYLWGPRSVLAEGGPRRPVGGLFRG